MLGKMRWRKWAEGIEQLHQCIAGRFRRPEPRRRALEYLRGLLSPVERKNGWQLAEQAGDSTPYGVQRLVSTCRWDADLVRNDLRDCVVQRLGDAAACWWWTRPDSSRRETSRLECSGSTAGRTGNCQIGVFPAYNSAKGRALLDPELCLPQVWVEDREWHLEAGAPADAALRTKVQLAREMLERAVESEVPFGRFTADEVYGSGRNLRLWPERADVPHVLAIKRGEKLWALTEMGPLQVRADRLASDAAEIAWVRLSAGNGAKGPRVYDWTVLDIRPLREPGRGR